jgi:GxxExxY protein
MMIQKDPKTYAIIGAAMEVHRELGNGFLEAVYQAALANEFAERGVAFRGRSNSLCITKGDDFLVVTALKIFSLRQKRSSFDQTQLVNQLKATKHRRGIY